MNRSDDPSHPLKSELPQGQEAAPPSPRSVDSLGFVMDVPIEVTVEIGRRSMKIADILRLGPGSMLLHHKVPGEPLVNHLERPPIGRSASRGVRDELRV